MILVFGGTTEGKQVARILDTVHLSYYYSTKTKVDFEGKGRSIHVAMTTEMIQDFCKTNKITHIINASHPFAEQLHKTIANISTEIPLIRFERQFSPRVSHEKVQYVNTFEEALLLFKENKYNTLLSLSGVQTISKLQSFWKDHQTWFRILDRDVSRAVAAQSNFPKENLLFGYPQTKKEEIELFTQISPEVIFTKESGINGRLDEKINATIEVGIPIVILKKPTISNRYICVESEKKLIELVTA